MFRIGTWLAAGMVMLVSACAMAPLPPAHEQTVAYIAAGDTAPFAEYAPVVVPQRTEERHNRVGRPSARYGAHGREEVYVDPDVPVFYVQRQTFSTAKGQYTNLIYRIHFERVPPIHLTQGENVGLFIIITLNAQGVPMLVTTVHSCGCYLAIVPTPYLPYEEYPDHWADAPQRVYGETLPSRLNYPPEFNAGLRPVVFLREGTHRVVDIKIADIAAVTHKFTVRNAAIEPVDNLKRLPLGDGVTSFYETEGWRRGYVKQPLKIFETLLMGWWMLDPFIGGDKELGDHQETGTVFYTSFKFWRRNDSDMWEFARFLRYWGWRL